MNDNHSDSFPYKPRWLTPLLQAAVEDHPVLILSGARQVGKTTLLQREFQAPDWRFISFDDLDALRQARRDPAALWAGAEQVVLDEVQKVPEILPAIKQAVDRERRRRRFVLSGSAHLLLMRQISETLAGRAIYLPLFPMTLGEQEENGPPAWFFRLFQGVLPAEIHPPARAPLPFMARGFMPPLLTLSRPEAVRQWWESYVLTYLERDLRQLSQIDSLADFHRVMEMLALRSGQMLNQTDVARDAGVSQPTVHRYLNLLETTCLFERLPAFSRNRTKRLIKTPKVYFLDPGLATHLSGHRTSESLQAGREAGGIFETLVFLHLRVLSHLAAPPLRLSYWRTANGREVDFVVEQGKRLIAIEAKLTTVPRYADAENLQLFLEEYPETTAALLVHAGQEVKQLGKQLLALPWAAF
jgi:predicted AAA+ superfamily ATPase